MKENYEKALKTSISVGLTIFIGRIIDIDSLFYAGIAAAICSQIDREQTVKLGFGRIHGTFVGAIIGSLFYFYIPLNPIFIGIGIFIIVFVCNTVFKTSQANIACIVFLGILVNLQGEKTPDFYAIHRVLDTTLGVFISIMVSHIRIFKKLPEQNA